jgi:hypothetical protein
MNIKYYQITDYLNDIYKIIIVDSSLNGQELIDYVSSNFGKYYAPNIEELEPEQNGELFGSDLTWS